MNPPETKRLDEALVEFDPTAPATPIAPAVSPRLRAVDIGQFLARDFPPREMMLAPILPTQGLVMLYSKRGVGKTHVALGIAYAVASGGQFLRWKAERPRRVLLLDGEMPGVAMQERLASIVAGAAKEPPSPGYLQIITPDLQEEGFPDLAGEEGQAAVAAHLDGVELVVVDNLSTLFRYGRENESESWGPVQQWILQLRRSGRSVLLIHHAGKSGAQRGTSRREDVLDTVIALRNPEDYSPEEGARFEVHIEKGRSIVGDDAKPIEAKLEVRDGIAQWTIRDLADLTYEGVIELTNLGMSVREIADEMGIGKSKVHRIQRKAREAGDLTDKQGSPDA